MFFELQYAQVKNEQGIQNIRLHVRCTFVQTDENVSHSERRSGSREMSSFFGREAGAKCRPWICVEQQPLERCLWESFREKVTLRRVVVHSYTFTFARLMMHIWCDKWNKQCLPWIALSHFAPFQLDSFSLARLNVGQQQQIVQTASFNVTVWSGGQERLP